MTGSLLDEKTFPELVAPYKSPGGTESPEQVGNFAVLKDALRSEWAGSRNQLQVLRVHNPVAVECFRLAAMKDGEGDAAIANQRSDPSDQPGHQVAVEVIQHIPQQHGIECVFGIAQSALKKPLGARRRRHFQTGCASGKFAPLFLFRVQKP